jgi:hypothetical protein
MRPATEAPSEKTSGESQVRDRFDPEIFNRRFHQP